MIPCANPLAQYQSHQDEVLEAIKSVLKGGNYIFGHEVKTFEQSFAAYCGKDYAVGLNSGTDALVLTMRALGIGVGDEVITVSHTALATVSAIIESGATPVLVDIEADYYTMDPACFKEAITPKTKAVIPVHLYGQPAAMDEIMTIARDQGILVIEDCAQATGATYKGNRVGSMGDAGCFSFYPTKNLGAIGDGGMVVTGNENLAQRIRRLAQYGWDENRTTIESGYNSRLDEMQAAILNVKLKTLDSDNTRRKKIAKVYDSMLSTDQMIKPTERPDTIHVYHLYVIASNKRDALKINLKERGVLAGIHYPLPVHRNHGYDRKCILPVAGLPVTEHVVGTILSLPMYPEITSIQLEEIVKCFVK
jgi:dTDP-4-amino-4,6-dideoxygalactose transaminase